MKIVLLHYHQRPGGVTKVIEAQRRVLIKDGHEVIVPQGNRLLDYRQTSEESAQDLAATLPKKADLWIIHNPTLGKNVLFPDLIELLARRGDRLLLQCHDFAEDGRPVNYRLVQSHKNLYPLADHVHYAFVNERDRSSLIAAGIPKNRCHALPNALNPVPDSAATPEDLLIFYPVRGIRRKNLGEFCLLAAHAPLGARFAIALAPENPEWKLVHDDWERFAKKQALPVEFDVVSSPAQFGTWLGRASHIATTSIAEGFGLTFLEPQLINKPLIGRRLPEITTDFETHGIEFHGTYDAIPVPLALLDLDRLQRDFKTSLRTYFKAYRRAIDPASAWEKLIEKGTLDFGNLPEAHQRSLIRDHDLPELRYWLNDVLIRESDPPQDVSHWSDAAYQSRLRKIIAAVTSSPVSPLDFLDKERILERFLHADRFHFLRT